MASSRSSTSRLGRTTALALPLLLSAGVALSAVPAALPAAAAPSAPPTRCDGDAAFGSATDPTSHDVVDATLSGSRLVLRTVDPTTGARSGRPSTIALPGLPGRQGGLAFDAAGRLYVVASSATEAVVYLARPGSTTTTAERVAHLATRGAVVHAAFAADGRLNLATVRSTRPLDLATGVAGTPVPLDAAAAAGDPGSCADPTVAPPAQPVQPSQHRRSATRNGTTTGGTDAGAEDTERAAAVAPRPRIAVTQSVDPTTYDRAGQRLTWTSVVTNFGDTSLGHLAVTDASSRLGPRTCTPVAQGGTLVAGASTTCTVTYTVPQVDVDANATRNDEVTATATTTQDGTTYRASASATAASIPVARPGLALTATVDPGSVARVGQRVGYAFVATNKGNQTLQRVLVTAPFRGLSPLVCAPVPLGGTLAPGAATTCRATRTTALADVGRSALADTAKARGYTRTRVAGAVAPVTVRVTTPGPVAEPDAVGAVGAGPVVVVTLTGNDHPAQPGGPAIDPSRTVFTGVEPTEAYGAKELQYGGMADLGIQPDGSVRVQPLCVCTGVVAADYLVYDVAGRSATGHLTVTLHQPAHQPEQPKGLTTLRNQPVTLDPLTANDPGQDADGNPSSFDPSSVRLTMFDQGGYQEELPPSGGSFSADSRRLDLVSGNARVGTYTVSDAGLITFSPAPRFSGRTPYVGYSLTSRAGSTVGGVFQVAVTDVQPVPGGDQTVATAYRHQAVLPGARAARPGDPSAPIDPGATVLVSAAATDAGKTLVTSRGTWRVRTDGSVTFDPADSFVGTTPPIGLAVRDRNGTRGELGMTVLVRPGPEAAPDVVTRPYGDLVEPRPLDNDVPGPHADGSPGSFVASSLVLPAQGQPAGSVFGTSELGGVTLTVPDEGTWYLDRAPLRFVALDGFVGATTPVTYQVTDDSGNVATGRLTAVFTSVAPAAVDDEASTTDATAVTLPGLTNDVAGYAPLVVASTTFPVAGQPSGATVSADGRSVGLPGQGTYVLAADGSALFTPTSTFVGTTGPVTYRVVDATGRSSTATLQVTVRPGPSGTPDVLAASDGEVEAPLSQNDTPGRNADGTLGTIDPLSVRLARDGQTKGWKVADDGYSATSGSGDAQRTVRVDAYTSIVTVTAPAGSTAVVGPVVYTAQDTVTDATGAQRHHPLRSTVQVSFTPDPPTATDDDAVTVQRTGVVLAAQSNDVLAPGASTVYATFDFSTLTLLPGHVGVLTVPGEGTYEVDLEHHVVDFSPDPAFTGRTTPVRYEESTYDGNTVSAALRVTVLPGGRARADSARTTQNRPVDVDVLGNDSLGSVPPGGTAAWASTPVALTTRGLKGARLSRQGEQLTVPGQGVYTVSPGSGSVRFVPDPAFSGSASTVTLAVSQLLVVRNGYWNQISLTSTLQVDVTPVAPAAVDDHGTAHLGTPLPVAVLANDRAGSSAAPLVGSTVRLRTVSGTPAGAALWGDLRTLEVPGRGVFLVAGDGEITFVPYGDEPGAPLTVGYQVDDANGTTVRADLVVTVER